MSRLLLMKSPEEVEGAKPMAFLPENVMMIGSVRIPGKPTGLKDEKGNAIKPKDVYDPNVCALIIRGLEQPLIVGESVREATRIINNSLDARMPGGPFPQTVSEVSSDVEAIREQLDVPE